MTVEKIAGTDEKLNQPFEIPLGRIEDDIGMSINGELVDYDTVVSPRAISEVHGIALFRTEVFDRLIRRVCLKGEDGREIYPYKDSEIRVFGRDPIGFDLGQNFISWKKVRSIMENLEGKVFADFLSQGISSMDPVQIYGFNEEGRKVVAFYVPAIAEIHGRQVVLIDGSHRSYICKSAGTTVKCVHIDNVSVPLPFDPITWEDTSVVDGKPPVEQRYQNLNRSYFRDLSSIGVDG